MTTVSVVESQVTCGRVRLSILDLSEWDVKRTVDIRVEKERSIDTLCARRVRRTPLHVAASEGTLAAPSVLKMLRVCRRRVALFRRRVDLFPRIDATKVSRDLFCERSARVDTLSRTGNMEAVQTLIGAGARVNCADAGVERDQVSPLLTERRVLFKKTRAWRVKKTRRKGSARRRLGQVGRLAARRRAAAPEPRRRQDTTASRFLARRESASSQKEPESALPDGNAV